MAMNTLLASLVNDVYVLTKRPDLEAATKQAVKSATLKLHLTDYFHKDIYETAIQFSVSDYYQQLEYKSLIPNWRALKYIRKVLPDTSANGYEAGAFLDIIVPESVLDDYGVSRKDICYGAGSLLQIRSSTVEKYFLVGCYIYPTIVDETYESWIAREIPSAVIYDAAATVFKGIGYDEQAAQFRQDSALWMVEIKNSNILVSGM